MCKSISILIIIYYNQYKGSYYKNEKIVTSCNKLFIHFLISNYIFFYFNQTFILNNVISVNRL